MPVQHGHHAHHEPKHHGGHAHPFEPDMLSVEEAQERLLALVSVLGTEEVQLMDCLGLALAENVSASFNIPGLPNSAMDGYAVRVGDVASSSAEKPVTLPVSGQAQAGYVPSTPLAPGTTVRIMTGAPIPKGTEAIIPFELTDEAERLKSGDGLKEIVIRHAPSPGDHIRPAGEDVQKGAVVLQAGHVLDPASLGMLAALGRRSVSVTRRPRVAVLATGDEVTEPGQPLEPGRLYDSNSYTIATAVRHYGGVPQLLGVARDNMDALREKLRAGLNADMLITSAGVSGGAYDMVKDALSEQGTMAFWSVRMRPAKPLAFGLLKAPDGRSVPHLGLPGNPVSALVAMVEFGRLALHKMMGLPVMPLPEVQAVLDEPIHNLDGRRVYARVSLERRNGELRARLTGSQSSNVLTSMVHAQGLAICPEDLLVKEAGERVTVQLLDWHGIPSNVL
ncbi:MAG: molybdopterin molybdotransferase MoeA [Chloroflexi bacterium]|nr:molybdopterin molybdotransferase MoeA [Chloroflexota bacterium]